MFITLNFQEFIILKFKTTIQKQLEINRLMDRCSPSKGVDELIMTKCNQVERLLSDEQRARRKIKSHVTSKYNNMTSLVFANGNENKDEE